MFWWSTTIRPTAPGPGATASGQDPRLHCLHRAGKLGLGTATVAAMRYAIEHGYEYVLNMDADFSHHPRYLPTLMAAMDEPLNGRRVDVALVRATWPVDRSKVGRFAGT